MQISLQYYENVIKWFLLNLRCRKMRVDLELPDSTVNLQKYVQRYVQLVNFAFQSLCTSFSMFNVNSNITVSTYRLHQSTPRHRANIMRDTRWLGIFALAFITTFTTKECSGQSESLLRVGKAINVFIRYGYLSISMKVISYNDTERWIFKEPTRNIFQVRRCWFWRKQDETEKFERAKKLTCLK